MFLYLIIYDLGQVSVVLFYKFLITLVWSEKIGNVNIHINMPMLVCMFGTGKQKLGNNVYETDDLCMGIGKKIQGGTWSWVQFLQWWLSFSSFKV